VIERLASENDEFQGLLVVPLTNLKSSWQATLAKVKGVSVHREWESFKKDDGPKVLLIHYEAMLKMRKQLGGRMFWDFVAFDESQRLKSRNGKASRFAGRLQAEHKVLLTGTPFDDIKDDPQELWAQFRFLAPHVFGTRWGDFDNGYLKPTGWMGKKRMFRDPMWPIFLKRIKPYCMRATKQDILPDLPPLTYKWSGVRLMGKQQRVYREMEQHSVATIGKTTATADLAITQLVKLQQICGGFIKDDEDNILPLGEAKLNRLRSLVERYDYPIIVFCKYVYEVLQVAEALSAENVTVSTIIGKTRKTRDETIERFQAGKTDVLVAQVRTGGVGLDLQLACTAFFYSTTFSFIDFEQAAARIHRAGQTSPVKIILIYAKDTVDKQIYDTVLSKRSVSESVLKRFSRTKRGGHTMAKKASGKKAKAKAKETEVAKDTGAKYGIQDLADLLDSTPAGVRVKLRREKIEKNGGRYGWDTKAELSEVADQLRAKAKAKDED
jgi:superfamily II DNA or RNA helicase